MSVPLAEAVRDFTTSIVVGKDIVCRTSVTNVGRMLDEMVSISPHGSMHAAAAGSAYDWSMPCPRMHAVQGIMLGVPCLSSWQLHPKHSLHQSTAALQGQSAHPWGYQPNCHRS